ncbi:MAG: PBP1A family penicillin-binding protein [Clostridia bacterium]
MKKIRIRKIFSTISDTVMTLILIGLTSASICGVTFAMYINEYIVPKADMNLSDLTLNLTSKVYYEDENGTWQELESLHGEQNRIWASIDTMPQYLLDAFVSIEDERFYTHEGVDWIRTVGAAVNWVVPIRSSGFGGSTITQQLIKNSTGDNDYSIDRKITEILRALSLEKKMEKDDILELYLNTIYLGRNAYGVFTAAQTYFQKDLQELNLAECAVIAGITNNPSYYDPFRYPDNIKQRQETILYMMFELGAITESEYKEALAFELDYKYAENEEKLAATNSYFVDAVIEDVLRDLQEIKGYSKQVATQLLYSGGLEIYSTVDLFVQETMENVYQNEDNFPNISGRDGALPESSMVIIDPTNGQVKGIVGGRGEKVGDRVLNRATQTTRSPGSSIKPLTVYAPAIDSGLITPISIYTDAPYSFTISTTGWPKNSYGSFRGQTTILEAVEDSTNTIAVSVLADLGVRESYNFATTKLGLTLVESRTSSSGYTFTDIALSPLALGGLTDGVSTLEMAAAYVPFANEGLYYEPITYTKVIDSQGNVILENAPYSVQSFEDPDTVFYMRQLLERVVNAGTGYGAKVTGMDTFGKTGTTDDNYDRWFAGGTPYYVGATWFGYDTQQAVTGVWGNPALNLWSAVMDEIHKDLPNATFADSPSFVSTSYCLDSGMLPNEYCSQDIRGSRVSYAYVSASDKPTETCNMHVSVGINVLNGAVASSCCLPDTIQQRVLLDLTRMYDGNVYLTDEQYTFEGVNPPTSESMYRALRTNSSITSTTYTGLLCDGSCFELNLNRLAALGYVYDEFTNTWIHSVTGEIYAPTVEEDVETGDDLEIPEVPQVDEEIPDAPDISDSVQDPDDLEQDDAVEQDEDIVDDTVTDENTSSDDDVGLGEDTSQDANASSDEDLEEASQIE